MIMIVVVIDNSQDPWPGSANWAPKAALGGTNVEMLFCYCGFYVFDVILCFAPVCGLRI